MKNFTKKVTMFLKSDNDPEKKVFNASRKAENHLNQVISKLQSEIVDAEIVEEEAKERYESAKFTIDWLTDPQTTLRTIDQTKAQLEQATKRLEDLKYTLTERESLLKEYQEEIEK